MSMRKRKFGIELDAGIVEGPKGLSIGTVTFKETLPNGNNVYEIFLENNLKIGEFITNKGDEGKEGKEGDTGRGILSVSKKEKIGLMTYYTILYTDNTVDEFAVEDGQNAYELWIGQGKEGDIEDFFEFYRGYSLDFTWRGTELGVKKSNEENYTFVDLRGQIGPNGRNLEFTWFGTNLGVRLEGEAEYQFVNLIGQTGKSLEFIWRGTELGVRAEGETEYKFVDLVGQGTDYILPIATKDELGGVKIGDGIDISDDGVVSFKQSLLHNPDIASFIATENSSALIKDPNFKDSVIIGHYAMSDTGLTQGSGFNTAIGRSALYSLEGDSKRNTAIGASAGQLLESITNSTCIGFTSSVTGSNQVQLGNLLTTTYCYGTVQNRSDERDKTDIKNTTLGLEFLMKLKPREYRWDYREAYIDNEALYNETKIINDNEELSNNEKKMKTKEIVKKYSIENVKKDESKKGWRFHQGFIAQEVFQTMRELGVDFGGFQDHSINGGKDVLSIGYNEFIPVLVKGIQEQQEQIEELSTQLQALKKRLEELNE